MSLISIGTSKIIHKYMYKGFFFPNINTVFHTNSTCLIPNSAFQSFFNVFTQISPLLATFGWNIFVVKNPLGGSEGKFFPKTSFMRNNPPAYGVPAAKYVQYTIFLNSPFKIYVHNVLFDSYGIPFNFFFRTFNNLFK